MFYQNSNDLVKNASISSGHIQHSNETRGELIRQQAQNANAGANAGLGAGSGGPGDDVRGDASLSLGAKFQNMIQGLIDTVTTKEGMSMNPDATVKQTVEQSKQYTQQETNHAEKVKSILAFIEKDDRNRRQNWVEVTDSANVAKYGYITKDGIFQIWHAPTSPSPNWLGTDEMKKNAGVIGCPATTSALQKIKIAGTWENIKPFQLVYADNDSSQTNPVFMMTNTGLRIRNDGMKQFSCGGERGNVIVTERPSADFQFTEADGIKPIPMGCYQLDDNIKDSDLRNRGFTFQEDLANASITQCKRRAEDIGSNYFFLSAPDQGQPSNRGGCWVYTGDGQPNINGLMTLTADETKCHNVKNPEADEDGYVKAYPSTTLKRLYGKDQTASSILYVSKRSGMWAGEQANEYTCSGAKGRNTTGDWGNFNRYCIFDTAEDAMNTCSSDPTCLGYTNTNKKFQLTRKPVVNPHGGTYFEKNADSTTSRTVALYALKSGGTTGVDVKNRNNRGTIGKIAYIDHNGERHEYPESALSFVKNTAADKALGNYINLGGYDTRSAESSYALKEVTPGGFGDAANLLYKASRDGWSTQKFHQLCDNKGATYTRAIMSDGRVLGGYLSVSWTSNNGYVEDTNAFLYDGEQKYSAQHGYWGAGKYASYMSSSYYPTFGGGHDFYIGGQTLYMNAYSFVLPDRSAPFKRKGWGAPISANLRDIEVYSVDAKIFPRTNPPDYARRLRIMPVGENITASMEKCAQMCNDTDKCGGFVYTKASAGGGDGKCEMKDRDKMYPVGVRVADPSKQLMLKVPMINAGFGDDACRVNNGKYTQIDTARYAHYPDTGAMTSGFKCNMSDIIPKEGTQTAPSTTGILAATDKQIGSTTQKINEYRAQTTASESFTTLREGLVSVVDASKNYLSTMQDVSNNLLKIANAKYQRERLLAMTEETNNLLMAESYKFILWSILAILAVLALLKIKEMFGQDDADSGGDSGGDGGGGILATILGWFGVLKSSTNTSDIADRTEDVKAALSSAGEQLKETGEQLAAGITEGADNLVASANQAMEGAVEGAKGIANKVSETATDAVNKVGDAVASAATSAAPAAASGSTSGSGSAVKTGGSKRRK